MRISRQDRETPQSLNCDHGDFTVVIRHFRCLRCQELIRINSPMGRWMLDRVRANKPSLHPTVQAVHTALIESYNELVARAGTNDPQVLADYANGRSKQ